MAAQITTTTATSLGKRKRTQVSHIVDDIFDHSEVPEDLEVEVDDGNDRDAAPTKVDRSRSSYPEVYELTICLKKRSKRSPKKDSKPQKPFPFLSLSAELRDEIYKHCLVDPNDIYLIHTFSQKRRIATRCRPRRDDGSACPDCHLSHPSPRTLIPNLLAVNKQINAEATAFLYQQPMTAADTTSLTAFLGAIGSRRRPLLRDLTIAGWVRGRSMQLANNAAMLLLADCTALRALRLDCGLDEGYRSTLRSAAEGFYRDGYDFFHAFADAKGAKADAALEILHFGARCVEEKRPLHKGVWAQPLSQDCRSEDWQERFAAELRACLLQTKRSRAVSKHKK